MLTVGDVAVGRAGEPGAFRMSSALCGRAEEDRSM